MTVGQLLTWQWQGYARYHQNTTNVLLLVAVVKVSLGLLALAVLGIVVSVIVQGRGHKLERVPPEPFTGPANVVGRLFFEQWVTFPRFVLSGGWSRNLAHSRK